ncbi:hypothetical protein [Ornithobacterium rhinotracheale]|uniref:hypothetical protein n=1 Tax=Ornithobacterium rhinotracheale TaxID=28251 RepID=UPI001FF1F27B|nr:hypothetical protein [Ornithobacterium rhinotracheale]MCK0201360.1 hypothetical protein [Ornithobacterium rhinotracheale]
MNEIITYNLSTRQGDSVPAWFFQLNIVNPLTGKPMVLELTDYDFVMEIKGVCGKVVRRLTLGNGLCICENKVFVDKIEKEDLEPSLYSYAIKMRKPNGEYKTFMKGKYNVEKELVNE